MAEGADHVGKAASRNVAKRCARCLYELTMIDLTLINLTHQTSRAASSGIRRLERRRARSNTWDWSHMKW